MDIGTLTGQVSLQDQFSDKLTETAGHLKDFMEGLSGGMGLVAVSVGAATAALVGLAISLEEATKKIVEFAAEGDKITGVTKAFNNLAAAAGNSGEAIVRGLSEGVHETVTQFELMQTSVKLVGSGIKLTEDQSRTLGSAARELGKAMGTDAAGGLAILDQALTTGQTRLLKRYGIVSDTKKAEQDLAKTYGESADRLTALGKLQADQTGILAGIDQWLGKVGVSQDTFTDKITQAKTAISEWWEKLYVSVSQSPQVNNALDSVLKALQRTFGGEGKTLMDSVLEWINNFADAIAKWAPPVIEFLKQVYDTIKDIAGGAAEIMSHLVVGPQLPPDKMPFGQFAKGAQEAKAAIVDLSTTLENGLLGARGTLLHPNTPAPGGGIIKTDNPELDALVKQLTHGDDAIRQVGLYVQALQKVPNWLDLNKETDKKIAGIMDDGIKAFTRAGLEVPAQVKVIQTWMHALSDTMTEEGKKIMQETQKALAPLGKFVANIPIGTLRLPTDAGASSAPQALSGIGGIPFIAQQTGPVLNDLTKIVQLIDAGPEVKTPLGIDWDAINHNTKAALEGVADEAQNTYLHMAARSDEFSKATIEHFRQVAVAARETADGVKTSWESGALAIMNFIPQMSGAAGDLAAGFSSVVVSLMKWDTASKTLNGTQLALAKTLSVVAGAINAWSSTANAGSKSAGALKGAISGAEAGAAFGPWGAAIGAAAGALVGFIRNMNAARNAVIDGVNKTFGSFDALQQKLQDNSAQLKAAGYDVNALWVNLTQKAKTTDQAKAALDAVTKAFADAAQKATDFNDSLNGLLQQYKQLGGTTTTGALQGMLQKLQDGKVLTADNLSLLQDIQNQGAPAWQTVADAVNRYGGDVTKLGGTFQAARLHDSWQQIIDDMKTFQDAGVSVNDALGLTGKQINDLVNQSVKFGTDIPGNMKNWIQALIDSGQLLDESGNKITDISKLHFGDDLQTSIQNLIDKISALIDKFNGVTTAIDGIPDQKVITVTEHHKVETDAGAGDSNVPAYGTGGFVSGARLATVGDAPEFITPTAAIPEFARLVAARLPKAGAGGNSVTVPVVLTLQNGEVIAKTVVQAAVRAGV